MDSVSSIYRLLRPADALAVRSLDGSGEGVEKPRLTVGHRDIDRGHVAL